MAKPVLVLSGIPRSTSSRLPFFGIITEILPVFSRKPVFGYIGWSGATLWIAVLSVAVWAHHMFVTGAVNLRVLLVHYVSDRGAHRGEVLHWIGTMWGGSGVVRHPDAVVGRFLTTFLFGV